jgi:hypothetical protein
MINLLLDTNIYTSDPSRSRAGFRVIEKLAKAGRVVLHIPYWVEQEFTSQQIKTTNELSKQVNDGLGNLLRQPLPENLVATLQQIKSSFSDIQEQVLTHRKSEFSSWAKDIQAVIHPIAESHAKRVTDDYFSGTPPFKTPKNRKDIPDSFIWQVIVDLADKLPLLYVIANDGAVFEACGNKSNIVRFTSFEEFIKQEGQTLLKQEEHVTRNLDFVLMTATLEKDFIERVFKDKIMNGLLNDRTVVSGAFLYSADIGEVIEVKSLNLEVNKGEYHGLGIFAFPLRAGLLALMREEVSSGDPLRPSYFEQTCELDVDSIISMEVDLELLSKEHLSKQELENLIHNSDIDLYEINDIDVVSAPSRSYFED